MHNNWCCLSIRHHPLLYCTKRTDNLRDHYGFHWYATFSVFLVQGLCTRAFLFDFLQCDVSIWWNSHINQFAGGIYWIFNDDVWSGRCAVIVLSVLTTSVQKFSSQWYKNYIAQLGYYYYYIDFFLIIPSPAANCKLPIHSEIYNCASKNTNKVLITIPFLVE